MNVVSLGGGTNSAAMIVGMIKRKIPIDLIIFSDTGGEKPHTYRFLEAFDDWLEENYCPRIVTVKKIYKGELYTLEQYLLDRWKFPGVIYGVGQCAMDFKIEPFLKYCNKNIQCITVWKRGEKVNRYVGFDAGEQRRVDKNKEKFDTDKKYNIHFPLIEWGWGRKECIAVIKAAGLPQPGKSSCFYCPNSKKDEIRSLWNHYPDLFARAVAMEHNAKKTKKNGSKSSIIGLGREWTWEAYHDEYMKYAIKDSDIITFPGFDEHISGCCCGMPCGCNDG